MTDGLVDIFRETRAVLLDFDGPVCRIFAGLPAASAAEGLKRLLRGQGAELPQDVAELDDPLKVLRRTADFAPELVDKVETALMAYEIKAVDFAEITPGARDLLAACAGTGRPVVIVSNNSEPAIERFLDHAGLDKSLAGVVGRPIGAPAEMKPHPRSVLRACEMTDVRPDEAVLIGDSWFDMEAAINAGARSIAYANAEGKDVTLAQAGADVVSKDMREIAAAVRASR
ncbi:HAD family hydrolase [Nonomuraea sp. NEAU-A123]|uniref:HAD family hydrolase n=1 Tax=Nonomuraea sp. NEAU-A123 TaxID=2839649 RepID=UPI001BE4494D|nr:HAD family hydrolase [Nonomuraea sp. NEAU-A123]MBT2226430.1 HAD family hydrolase [Nonomuraea sp. NEAU-A123]